MDTLHVGTSFAARSIYRTSQRHNRLMPLKQCLSIILATISCVAIVVGTSLLQKSRGKGLKGSTFINSKISIIRVNYSQR